MKIRTVTAIPASVPYNHREHPDDPPVDEPLGGAARIFTSPAALAKAYQQVGGSPSWGLNLCLGTVSEIGGETTVNEDRLLRPEDAICYVHSRDVLGTVPNFAECFLGEGNFNPARVIRRLASVSFDSFLIDDYVPAMIGDLNTWYDTSPEAYRGRARHTPSATSRACSTAWESTETVGSSGSSKTTRQNKAL